MSNTASSFLRYRVIETNITHYLDSIEYAREKVRTLSSLAIGLNVEYHLMSVIWIYASPLMKGKYYVDILAEPLKLRYSWITAIVYCLFSLFPGLFTRLFSETEKVKIFNWSIGFSIFGLLFNVDQFRSHFNRKDTDDAFVVVCKIQCVLIAVIYFLCIFFTYSLRRLFIQLYVQEEKGFTDLEALSLAKNKDQKFRPVTHSKLAKYSASVAPQLIDSNSKEDLQMNHLPPKKKRNLLNRPKPPPIQISHINTKPSTTIFSSRTFNALESTRSLLNREESSASALPLFAPLSPLTRENTSVFRNESNYNNNNNNFGSSSFVDSPRPANNNAALYNSYKKTPFVTTHLPTPVFKSVLKYKKTGLSKVKYSVIDDSENNA